MALLPPSRTALAHGARCSLLILAVSFVAVACDDPASAPARDTQPPPDTATTSDSRDDTGTPDPDARDDRDTVLGPDTASASDTRNDTAAPSDTRTDATTNDPPQLEVRFLGVGGYSIRVGNDHVLTAPLYTNPDFDTVLFGEVRPEPDIIDRFVDADAIADATAILAGHGHYDHLLDVPYIWNLTNEATIYGNMTTKRLLAGFAPEADPSCEPRTEPVTWPTVPPENIVALNDPADFRVDSRLCNGMTSCLGTWPTKTGEWIDVPKSNVRIRALCSSHPDQFWVIHFAPGCLEAPDCVPQTDPGLWFEGDTLAYLVDFLDERGEPIARVYYQDAPTTMPTGLVPSPILAEKAIDVALLNVGSYDSVEDHPTATVDALAPRYAIGGHWESFFQTQDEPVMPIPLHASVEDWEAALAAAMPRTDESPLVIDGVEVPVRHSMPDPGTRFVVPLEGQ